MRREQIEKILSLPRDIEAAMSYTMERIRVLESKRLKVTAGYSRIGGGGGTASRIEELTARIIELEDEISLKEKRYLAAMKRANCLLKLLRGERTEFAAVLQMRYLDGFDWKRICDSMAYSRMQLDRIRNRALKLLVEKTAKR